MEEDIAFLGFNIGGSLLLEGMAVFYLLWGENSSENEVWLPTQRHAPQLFIGENEASPPIVLIASPSEPCPCQLLVSNILLQGTCLELSVCLGLSYSGADSMVTGCIGSTCLVSQELSLISCSITYHFFTAALWNEGRMLKKRVDLKEKRLLCLPLELCYTR